MNNLQDKKVKAPEFIIFYALQAALAFIRKDYEDNAADETQSFLYKLVHDIGIERYEYFTQAKALFLASADDRKSIELSMMYNNQAQKPVNVYISLPSETPAQNTVGYGQESEPLYTDTTHPDESVTSTFRNIYTRRFKANYNLVITSDNADEVVLLYHIFKSLLISLNTHFSLAGLQNVGLGGQDLKIYSELIPKSLYIRGINIFLEYETSSFDFAHTPTITQMIFKGTPIQ